MELWIIVHYHRFGDSAYPIRCDGVPPSRKIVEYLKRHDDYEEDREDEGYCLHGPFKEDPIDTLAD